MLHGRRIVVVMPAYNAARTLERTYDEIPRDVVDEVILVDDASDDDTVARRARARHHHASCTTEPGLRRQPEDLLRGWRWSDGADIVVMLHPDYQYTPQLIPAMAALIARRRLRRRARLAHPRRAARCAGGMPRLQVRRQPLPDAGREPAARRQALRVPHRLPRLLARACSRRCRCSRTPTTSSSTTRCSLQALCFGFRVGEITCPTKYFAEASSINFRRSVVYGFGVLGTALAFRLARWGLARPRIFDPGGRRLSTAAAPAC